MLRKRYVPPADIFSVDPWVFEATRFDAALASQLVSQAETLFALLFVDDEPFVLTTAEILSFRHALDFRHGTLRRDVRWTTPSGKRLHLRTVRLVSFSHRHLAAIEYELTAEDADAEVVISSELANRQPLPVNTNDPRLAEGFIGRVLHPAGTRCEGLRTILSYRTQSSGLVLGCGMDHRVEGACAYTAESRCNDDFAAVVFKAVVERGKFIRIHKYLSYHYSENPDEKQIRSQTAWTLSRAMEHGFARILDRQRSDVGDFWSRADVQIEGGHPRIQQVIRWNLFQLLQGSQRAEGHGIGARGLTGKTYEGHYFWDTEIYVLPFLIYSEPRVARALLKFRYDMLDKARARARELALRGATFPWRTINGEEASAYYAAGTAQYHINADIAYALRKYVEVSGDDDFLRRFGAEILIETARLWRSLGFFSERKDGHFCIDGVTGPDEYSAVRNNNYFTNLLARENLRYAAQTVRSLEQTDPEGFEALVRRTGLAPTEPADWEEAAKRMYLPYDERFGVHPRTTSSSINSHGILPASPRRIIHCCCITTR